MVNKVVYNYLKANYENYDLTELKNKLSSSGYSDVDVNEALELVKMESSNGQNIQADNTRTPHKTGSSGGYLILLGAISGIILILLNLFSTVSSFYPNAQLGLGMTGAIAILIILSVSLILMYLGFYKVGKCSGVRSLKISSLLIVISIAILVLLSIFSSVLVNSYVNSVVSSNIGTPTSVGLIEGGVSSPVSGISDGPAMPSTWGYILIFGLMISLVLFVLIVSIMFFVGIYKTRKDIFLGGILGILGIISVCIGIISISYIIYMMFKIYNNPALIFDIMLYSYSHPLLFKIISIVSNAWSYLLLMLEVVYLFIARNVFE